MQLHPLQIALPASRPALTLPGALTNPQTGAATLPESSPAPQQA